ncbi:hypothetical protein TNCV_3863241 [Trichonephila clavipes]|uniref:Uncharacterized protein n=1 Tax=Trichonephila clavipes TaxID=2585209 RepID=A0A8X6VHA9_TRICX|nr:hypothetical protein TNCV_3863241 [Trichonephila clavipes]
MPPLEFATLDRGLVCPALDPPLLPLGWSKCNVCYAEYGIDVFRRVVLNAMRDINDLLPLMPYRTGMFQAAHTGSPSSSMNIVSGLFAVR